MVSVLRTLHGAGRAGLDDATAAECARVLGADGLAVSLQGSPPELVWSTPGQARALEDAQFTLGEGPICTALRDHTTVFEPDLARAPGASWPAFLPAAAELGIAAVFVFPLHIGAVSLGGMTVHRALPGPLGERAMRDAAALADALTLILAAWAAGGPEAAAPQGNGRATGHWHGPGGGHAPGNGDGLTNGGTARHAAVPEPGPGVREFEEAALHRAEVHQATGMISVQLRVPLAEALTRLRAYAYRTGSPVTAVAEDVVARRIRFDAESGSVGWENGSHDR